MSMNPKLSVSTFILLLLLTFLLIPSHSSSSDEESDDDLEQLLAVDEQSQEDRPQHQQSEAETVSKAQRIVLELTGDNAKRVVDGNEFVLVLGYAPWCARSADLMPRFSEAATGLKEIGSSVLMAKIDGDRYGKVASELEIKGFPTLLLFVNGTSQPYSGGFSAEDIVIWVQKKTGSPIITVNTLDEAQIFLNKYHTFVVGLFHKFEGSEYNEFVKAAKSDNEIQFVETSDNDVAKLLFPQLKTNTVFIGLVKPEAERYTAYDGPFKMEKLLEFLGNNKFPLITRLTESNTVWVYSSPVKLQVMLFSKAYVFQSLAQPLEDLARKFKSKLMFIYVDIANENLAMPFLTLFGIEHANKTVDFCSGLADGTVSRYYRSEPVPDNVDDFPTILLYKSGEKEKPVITFLIEQSYKPSM
uniref:protein disulfide-isomerase n=1 Tax=Brassica campestris TaxID=3711 RepID=M4DCV2_BRACM